MTVFVRLKVKFELVLKGRQLRMRKDVSKITEI